MSVHPNKEEKPILRFPGATSGAPADGTKAVVAQVAAAAWDLRVRAMSLPAEELAKAGAPPAWAAQALAEWCGRLVEVAKAALLLPADASLEFVAPFMGGIPGAVAFVRSGSFPCSSPGAHLGVRVFPIWEPVWTWLQQEGFVFATARNHGDDDGFWRHDETAVAVAGPTVDALKPDAVVAFKTDTMRRVAEARRTIAGAETARKADAAPCPDAVRVAPGAAPGVARRRAVARIMDMIRRAQPISGDHAEMERATGEILDELDSERNGNE